MSAYESKVWAEVDGREVLVPVTSWDIGQEMGHHDECRVRDELRRSARTATPPERRLELARATACTCGRKQQMEEALTSPGKVKVSDHRDNRDSGEVGAEYLSRQSTS